MANRDENGQEMASVLFAIGNMGRQSHERAPMPTFRPTSFTPMVRPMSMGSNARPRSMASTVKKERPLSFAPSIEEYSYIEETLSQIPPKAKLRDSGIYDVSPPEKEVGSEEKVGREPEVPQFKPGYRFYMAFSSLAVLAMMVSLDGTSVSVALPVCLSICRQSFALLMIFALEIGSESPWHRDRGLLDRHKLPAQFFNISATNSSTFPHIWPNANTHILYYQFHGWYHYIKCGS